MSSQRKCLPLPLSRAFLFLSVASASLVMLSTTPVHAATNVVPKFHTSYSCDSNHCYGIYKWDYGSNIQNNILAYIQVSYMSCNGCTNFFGQENGFVDNETWFSQDSGNYWVEGGYSTYNSCFPSCSATVNYFWADNRPGRGYNEHALNTVPSDDYGAAMTVSIAHSGTNTFRVQISSPYHGTQTYYSTSNSMSPNHVNSGQELEGTGGASANPAEFTEYDNGNLLFPSDITENAPPYIYKSGSSNWTTYCC